MSSFGVIFDADGVLFDSERQSFRALRLAVDCATEGRIRLDADRLEYYSGRDDRTLVEDLNRIHGLSIDMARFCETKLDCYRESIAADPVVAAGGVLDLLDQLDLVGIPHAVATSAIRAKLEITLAAVGLQGRFDIVVSADDVTVGKPDPAIFLLAAKRLGLDPGRLVVFEDTINGVTAANKAGMFSVGVPGTFPRGRLTHARELVDNLGQVTVSLLGHWMDGGSGKRPDENGGKG